MLRWIRKFLHFLGYDVIKIYKKPFLNKDSFVNVGKFKIKMPRINPLIKTYAEVKNFNGELTRLISAVGVKYDNFKAIDIGANAGDTAALIKSVYPSIHLLCIEGDSKIFKYLKDNIVQFTSVDIYNVYLGDKEEKVLANVTKSGWNSTIVKTESGKESISLVTLDGLLETNYKDSQLNFKFIKIDTEGYDTIILRGAKRYLALAKPVIYFEYNRDNMKLINEDGLSSLKKLKELGYYQCIFFDDRGRYILQASLDDERLIDNLHEYANGKDGLIYYYNICLVHKQDDDIAERIIDTEATYRNSK